MASADGPEPKTPVIGRLRNDWRQRHVTVYDHPTDPDQVISVGVPFDGSKPIVCEEPRSAYREVIAHYPKLYVYK